MILATESRLAHRQRALDMEIQIYGEVHPEVASSLSGIGGINAGGKSFRRYVRSLRASGLDIVVVIDSTGSMESVIHQARPETWRPGGRIPMGQAATPFQSHGTRQQAW